jgi:hypothetical protein
MAFVAKEGIVRAPVALFIPPSPVALHDTVVPPVLPVLDTVAENCIPELISVLYVAFFGVMLIPVNMFIL